MSEVEIEVIARGIGTESVGILLEYTLEILKVGGDLDSEKLAERIKNKVITILSKFNITEKPN